MEFSGIILAAGSGKRTGLKYNKVLYEIKGKKVIEYSIENFKKYPEIKEIILVVSESEIVYFVNKYRGVVDKIIVGGNERQDSVYKALNEAVYENVIIHDGARPYLPEHSMEHIFQKIDEEDVMTLGVKLKDTVQEISGNRVTKTLDRSKLIAVQTPQVFKRDIILEAHQKAIENKFYGTDDTVLVEKFIGKKAYVIEGDYRNIKLTTLEDIKLLEVIL